MFNKQLIKFILILILNYLIEKVNSNKVIELSDKFLDIYNNTTKSFLVKFYTPSCHQCKKLEADYMHVAQELHELDIIVSRLDSYRYRSVANFFNIYEYPSIVYINKTKIIKYENNKYKGDIIDFVKRMMGEKILTLNSCEQINRLANEHDTSFIYFNSISSIEYNELAEHHIKNTWFYLSTVNCFGFEKDSIYSIKRSLTNTPYINKYDSAMGITLKEWVDFMHYPKFINITIDNINRLLKTNKLLVIVMVKKYISINRFAHPDHKNYLEMFERISHLFLDDYYLFGWTSEFELISNIAINNFEQFPTFIVLNTKNYEYYYQLELTNSTQNEIVRYLEKIKMGKNLEINGGNTILHKLQRNLFIIKNKISKMNKANPLMTLLLFALPSTIFMIILCGCLRNLTTNDDDEKLYSLIREDYHQKLD